MTNSASYTELLSRLRHIHLLSSVGDLLGWDEQVNLPPASADLRAAQSAAIAEVVHAAASEPALGTVLDSLEKSGSRGLPDGADAVVREARRGFDRATKLPADFVREQAAHSSRAFHAWAKAREASDFPAFAPLLEKHLELARQEAAHLGYADRPYDYFIDRHDPGLTAAAISRLFAELKRELVPFVRSVTGSTMKAVELPDALYPVDQQEAFLREVTAALGFDYRRGRIDVAVHPFCSGGGEDTRMTTRYDERDPLSSLFGAIHETGHGLYEQGLPAEHAGNALGMHAGMGVHESQSRLWENQVGRGAAFWRHFEPRFRERFGRALDGFSSADFLRAVNAVRPTLIRVEADEVTYNLHIILRFELEQRLFSGTLKVAELPGAWRESARELLGAEPANDREGVLQDVHWSGGAFGYFPSYCLGNMLAAQLWYRALAALPGLEDDFARGDFSRLLGWLRTQVHARGRRLNLLELTRTVTGEDLSPKYLMRYLQERYRPRDGAA